MIFSLKAKQYLDIVAGGRGELGSQEGDYVSLSPCRNGVETSARAAFLSRL
jgi:hypothetical protein